MQHNRSSYLFPRTLITNLILDKMHMLIYYEVRQTSWCNQVPVNRRRKCAPHNLRTGWQHFWSDSLRRRSANEQFHSKVNNWKLGGIRSMHKHRTAEATNWNLPKARRTKWLKGTVNWKQHNNNHHIYTSSSSPLVSMSGHMNPIDKPHTLRYVLLYFRLSLDIATGPFWWVFKIRTL